MNLKRIRDVLIVGWFLLKAVAAAIDIVEHRRRMKNLSNQFELIAGGIESDE